MRKQQFDLFPLGKAEECRVSTNSAETQLNNNIVVVGGSGSGKTVSVLDPMLLHLQHGNAVGVFTKHSQRTDDLQGILEQRGYKVCVLDFTRPDSCRYGYDPLHYCHSEEDIRDLAMAIIRSDHSKVGSKDPYWDDGAANLLTTVLRYVKNGHYAGGRTMTAALKLLDSIPYTFDWNLPEEPEEMAYRMEDPEDGPVVHGSYELMWQELPHLYDVDPLGAATWQALLVNNAPNTKACLQSSVGNPVHKLFTGSVRKILKKGAMFDFARLLEPKTVLFVYTSPVSKALNAFISIFYRQLFQYLFQAADNQPGNVLPQPVQVLCDDFATGCPVPDFPQLISIFREKGIAVTLLIQSESQLAGLYGGDDATTIINNCDTYIYLGGTDLGTCEHIAKRINQPLQRVLFMPIGREFFFRRGQNAVITDRYEFLEDPLYKGWKRKKARTGTDSTME